MRLIWQPLYTLYVLSAFVLLVLILFPVIAVISTGNSPASRRAIWRILKRVAAFWLTITGMPVKKTGRFPAQGKYIVVANHISYLDAVVIFPAIDAYFRPLGKKEIAKIPVLGFIYKQIVLLVDRSSKHSRGRSMRLMFRTVRHEANILIFPEGTFNETSAPLKEFYDGAFRLAINAQTPILPILLPDTVHRWHYSAWWKLSPGRNRVVYLEPVPVAGLEAGDLQQLKEKVYAIMEAGLVRYGFTVP